MRILPSRSCIVLGRNEYALLNNGDASRANEVRASLVNIAIDLTRRVRGQVTVYAPESAGGHVMNVYEYCDE